MKKRLGATRLTWNREFQYPFESGWSIFQKLKVLNDLGDYELMQLIAREPLRSRRNRLGDCADSSWIDFQRFSELLEVPEQELRNGFWDQLGIKAERPLGYDRRYCKICWEAHCYHCVLFDLVWLKKCPWHAWPLGIFKRQEAPIGSNPPPWGAPPEVPFDELISLALMGKRDRYRRIGYVLEYLEWWRAVQNQVPQADELLRGLVSTYHQGNRDETVLRWQAGFAESRIPRRPGSWVLEDVEATPCRYVRVMDAGRSPGCMNDSSSVRDDTGRGYRAIRRHVFRRYVRRHRACLSRLAWLNRDDLLSLTADGVCATCLAYVVWRMATENLVVMDGLFARRAGNFALHLSEPWPESPSDDPTRLRFTYMHFFGIWAAIVDGSAVGGLQSSMQDTAMAPQVVYTRDNARPLDAPMRMLHCIFPDGDALAVNAGRPCSQPWKLLPFERQCVVRSQAWLQSLTPSPKPSFQVYLETDPNAMETLKRLWV
jgi:hypothetical protein